MKLVEANNGKYDIPLSGAVMRSILLVAILALAACDQMRSDAARQEAVPVGRWTIIYSPHVQRSTMLLDTVTGRTWNLVAVGEGDNSHYAWEPVERMNERLPLTQGLEEQNSSIGQN